MLSILRESDSIKRALTDLHRTTMLLHNYDVMNFTGFIKIIKKHDKSFPSRKGRFKGFMKKADVIEGNESEQLGSRMEKLFADWFCDGNVREARAKMLPKRGDGLQMDWSQLRLGYRLGMCAILTLWVCWDCIWGLVHEQQTSIGGRTAFPVFRACGGLLLVHWFWGISVFVWQRCEYYTFVRHSLAVESQYFQKYRGHTDFHSFNFSMHVMYRPHQLHLSVRF